MHHSVPRWPLRGGGGIRSAKLRSGGLGGEINPEGINPEETSELDGSSGTFGAEFLLEDRAPESVPLATRGGEADEPNDVEETYNVFSRHVHGEVYE